MSGSVRSIERLPKKWTWKRLPTTEIALGLFVLCIVGRRWLTAAFEGPTMARWSTVFVAICVQAMPFLVLGVSIAGLVSAFATPERLRRVLPSHPLLSVPVGALGGAVLPGCECSSGPIAARLTERGVPLPTAIAFLLSSPAINPVVLVATAVAFPRQPEMVIGRFVASALTATIVGLLWWRIGRPEWLSPRWHQLASRSPEKGTWRQACETALHDFAHAGGYLVFGAIAAATLQTVIPRSSLDSLGSNEVVAVLALALLAVVLSICSEADAFVATGLTSFLLSARLTFLVVGPMVDLKLVALQSGTFGPQFARRFAPLTLVVAISISVLVAKVLI
jgi:uncharacterized protein